MQYKKMKWNWRKWFTKAALEMGERDVTNGKIVEFKENPSGTGASGKTAGGFSVRVDHVPTTYRECVNSIPWNSRAGFSAYQGTSIKEMHYCNCSQGYNGQLCRHLASLMIYWEIKRGPFEFTQTEEERLEEIREEKIRQEMERKKRKEEQERNLQYAL